MRLGQDVLTDLDRALAHEWLLADGVGGSALGTAAGARTRSGHALLVAPGRAGASVALLAVDERLTADGITHDLATHRWTHAGVSPAGHRLLESFELDPWPTWRFRAGSVTIEKSLFLLSDHAAVVVSYRHVAGPVARITVAPVVAARGPSELARENAEWRGVVKGQPGRLRIETLTECPALTLWHNGAFLPARLWQRGHDVEAPERDDEAAGIEDRPAGRGPTRAARRGGGRIRRPAFAPANGAGGGDDALAVGYVDAGLAPGGSLHLVASIEEGLFKALAQEGRLGAPPPGTLAGCVALLEAHERARLSATRVAAREGADLTARQAATAQGGRGSEVARRAEPLVAPSDPWVGRLAGAIEAGLVRRGPRLALVASLPEGDERPEFALRAIPGLVSLRAFEPAAAVLRGLAEYLDEGFVPESFDPDGTPRHGDPRPSLWLVHASELFARRSGELELVRESLYPALESIMQYFRAGTRDGVRVDADGLLTAGEGEAAAKHADVNALWYHALVAMSQLARLVGRKESGAFYLAWAREHQMRFAEKFWDEASGRLAHALDASGAPVHGLRPEHVLCASLSPTLLPAAPAKRLLEAIGRELFTPLGLRAAPGARQVLPGWLGPYASAWLRAHERSPEARATVRGWFESLGAFAHADGHLPEAFELDPAWKPGRPLAGAARAAGAPAAFVAPAEFARVWVEELVHAEDAATVG